MRLGGPAARQHDDEFVAAVAGAQVVRANRLLHAPRHLIQRQIAGAMAVAVVDRLEAVEIDQQNGHGRPFPPRAGELLPGERAERTHVRDLGQRIGGGFLQAGHIAPEIVVGQRQRDERERQQPQARLSDTGRGRRGDHKSEEITRPAPQIICRPHADHRLTRRQPDRRRHQPGIEHEEHGRRSERCFERERSMAGVAPAAEPRVGQPGRLDGHGEARGAEHRLVGRARQAAAEHALRPRAERRRQGRRRPPEQQQDGEIEHVADRQRRDAARDRQGDLSDRDGDGQDGEQQEHPEIAPGHERHRRQNCRQPEDNDRGNVESRQRPQRAPRLAGRIAIDGCG